MNHKQKATVGIVIVLLVLSFLPIYPDPFDVMPKDKYVNFWEWLYREIYELIYGEVGSPGQPDALWLV